MAISGKSFRHVESGRINLTISEIVLLNADNFPFGLAEKDSGHTMHDTWRRTVARNDGDMKLAPSTVFPKESWRFAKVP